MCLKQITGKDSGNLALLVQGDVEEKSRANPQGNLPHLFPNRIAVGDSKDRLRMGDVGRAMIAHHRLEPCHPRHDAFGAPAETGKEMRLDEPGNNAHAGFDKMAVDQGRCAVAGSAEFHQSFWIFGLVIQHAIILNDSRCEHVFQLSAAIGPMRAELIEQCNSFARHAGQMLQQPWNQPLIWRRPREVRE